MIAKGSRPLAGYPLFKPCLAFALLASTALAGTVARADDDNFHFKPGHLLLSRSVYINAGNITAGTTLLPPNCVLAPNCVTATADGTYPMVFNNDLVDGSFGITSKIMLDELKPDGEQVQSLEVPNSSKRGITPSRDQMVTSFSSKSEHSRSTCRSITAPYRSWATSRRSVRSTCPTPTRLLWSTRPILCPAAIIA
jgi:hypothetical protein